MQVGHAAAAINDDVQALQSSEPDRSLVSCSSQCDLGRLGAVFVPTVPRQDALFARVIPHSPAFEAGIRDGDVLLKIDKLDVTNWRTRPGILPLARFWEEPAGTRLCLTLERQGVPYSTTVRLREILSASQSLT